MLIKENNQLEFLTNEQLKNKAPAAFTEYARQDKSDKYKVIRTIDLVEELASVGWHPVMAMQTGSPSKTENIPYNKHLIRFQNKAYEIENVGRPEILLTNSLDGTCSYTLRVGFYRFICTNGLMASTDFINPLRIRHVGYKVGMVKQYSQELVKELPKLFKRIELMSSTELKTEDKAMLALNSISEVLKTVNVDDQLINRVLSPRHYEDKDKNDLWTVFNTIQENLIKGGLRYESFYYNEDNKLERRNNTTRKIKAIDRLTRVNEALWGNADNLLKGAA